MVEQKEITRKEMWAGVRKLKLEKSRGRADILERGELVSVNIWRKMCHMTRRLGSCLGKMDNSNCTDAGEEKQEGRDSK